MTEEVERIESDVEEIQLRGAGHQRQTSALGGRSRGEVMAYSVAESVTKNTALMLATQLSTWISGLVLLLFLPRYLGNVAYGELYLAMSIQMIFQYVINYGGQYQVSENISRDRQGISEFMSNSAVLRIGIWIASMAVTYVICELAKYPSSTVVIVMILGLSNFGEGWPHS